MKNLRNDLNAFRCSRPIIGLRYQVDNKVDPLFSLVPRANLQTCFHQHMAERGGRGTNSTHINNRSSEVRLFSHISTCLMKYASEVKSRKQIKSLAEVDFLTIPFSSLAHQCLILNNLVVRTMRKMKLTINYAKHEPKSRFSPNSA